jgi:hypothetical protein
MNARRRSLHKLWTDVTCDELWVYIGLQVLMGIIQKTNYHMFMYWTKDDVFLKRMYHKFRSRLYQLKMQPETRISILYKSKLTSADASSLFIFSSCKLSPLSAAKEV